MHRAWRGSGTRPSRHVRTVHRSALRSGSPCPGRCVADRPRDKDPGRDQRHRPERVQVQVGVERGTSVMPWRISRQWKGQRLPWMRPFCKRAPSNLPLARAGELPGRPDNLGPTSHVRGRRNSANASSAWLRSQRNADRVKTLTYTIKDPPEPLVFDEAHDLRRFLLSHRQNQGRKNMGLGRRQVD